MPLICARVWGFGRVCPFLPFFSRMRATSGERGSRNRDRGGYSPRTLSRSTQPEAASAATRLPPRSFIHSFTLIACTLSGHSHSFGMWSLSLQIFPAFLLCCKVLFFFPFFLFYFLLFTGGLCHASHWSVGRKIGRYSPYTVLAFESGCLRRFCARLLGTSSHALSQCKGTAQVYIKIGASFSLIFQREIILH